MATNSTVTALVLIAISISSSSRCHAFFRTPARTSISFRPSRATFASARRAAVTLLTGGRTATGRATSSMRATFERNCNGNMKAAPVMAVAKGAASTAETEAINEVVARLENPSQADVGAFKDSLRLFRDIQACDDPQLKEALNISMQVLSDGLRLYGSDRLVGSYNGGKDAVAIMHLHRAAVAAYSVQRGRIYRAKFIYFENEREFPEVQRLVKDHEEQYNLDLSRFNLSFVDGLAQHMEEQSGGRDDVSFAFVLGTRKGDPNCGVQSSFTPSSDWMPPFMRVNPILDWDYGQVWAFLRTFELPYCSLYDRGYTSLGNLDNTHPNPALRRSRPDCSGLKAGQTESGQEYFPAYMLSDWTLERAGRGKRMMDSLACELKDLDLKRRKVREAGTAGLVIIGDEILKGKCVDINAPFATKQLWEKGICVKQVVTVPDDKDVITEAVRRQVQDFDIVITSGGVGPTHDDITIFAVADALNQGVRQNEDMLNTLVTNFKLESINQLTEAQLKMAMLPELAKLRVAPIDQNNWPILQCENVFILPGVPQFFRSKMQVIAEHFLDARPMYVKKVVLSADELLIVDSLNEAVAAHPNVQFGSYPYIENPVFKTVVTLEGPVAAEVAAAADYLVKALPPEYVLKVVDDDDLKDV